MTYVYFSALVLAVAVILYISAVNDEISQRKPAGSDEPQFEYSYGWAFYCAGGAFVCSMMASVANISAYLTSFPRHEDMVILIPGLHSNYDFSKVWLKDKPEMTGKGSQNPTIIFWSMYVRWRVLCTVLPTWRNLLSWIKYLTTWNNLLSWIKYLTTWNNLLPWIKYWLHETTGYHPCHE